LSGLLDAQNANPYIKKYTTHFDIMSELTRKEAQEKINDFFKNLDGKSSDEVKKIKKLAMKFNIRLENLRKKFCRKCYSSKLKFKQIKKGIKTVECKECGNLMRWKV
jgi:RNase P subunit RPR2